jgi:hypothetical protein
MLICTFSTYLVLRGGGGRFLISFITLYFCITKKTSEKMQMSISIYLRSEQA